MGVLEVLALVAQLSGLDVVMLITLAAHLLRILQCEVECAKLEECTRKLRMLLLQCPAPTGRDMATQLPAMAAVALVEADGLVGSYRGSTLWCRVRTGTSMKARLQDMQDRVNCFCTLVLNVHTNLITDHPVSDTNATVIRDPLHGAETCDSASDVKGMAVRTGQGGADDQLGNTEPGGGFESAV